MNKFLSKPELNALHRKEAFSTLIGSHNYNLANENSDKDYKVFVYPCYEDFYFSHQVSKNEKINNDDFDVKDIRFLTNLLSTANPAYLEILYSVEVENKDNKLYQKLLTHRDEIIHSHLHQMYKTSFGQIIERLKVIRKSNVNYSELSSVNGRSFCKALTTALRIKDLMIQFFMDDFNNFENKLFYHNDNPTRQKLLNVKSGLISENELNQYLNEVVNFVDQKDFVTQSKWDNKAKKLYSEVANKNLVNENGFVYNKLLFDLVATDFKENFLK